MSDALPHFDALLTRAKPLDPVPTTVIAPESDHTLAGALLAADHSLITPILFGDVAKSTRGPTGFIGVCASVDMIMATDTSGTVKGRHPLVTTRISLGREAVATATVGVKVGLFI